MYISPTKLQEANGQKHDFSFSEMRKLQIREAKPKTTRQVDWYESSPLRNDVYFPCSVPLLEFASWIDDDENTKSILHCQSYLMHETFHFCYNLEEREKKYHTNFFKFIFNVRIIIILCWFLPYSNMDQPQIYICPLPLEPASHLSPYPTPLDCHRALVWVSWIIQQIPTGYFTYVSVYVFMLLSPLSHQFWPINDQVVTEDQFVHSGLDSVKFMKFIIYKI